LISYMMLPIGIIDLMIAGGSGIFTRHARCAGVA